MYYHRNKPLLLTLALTAVLAIGMLGLYRNACAQQQRGNPLPFSNSVEQRQNMVKELREIKELLREQNALLRKLVNDDDAKTPNAIQ